MSGLSGLSGLVPEESDEDAVDQEDAEDATGTPSMELTPAESTDAAADQPAVGGETTDDSDAGATESE
jgi:hypothetical protein